MDHDARKSDFVTSEQSGQRLCYSLSRKYNTRKISKFWLVSITEQTILSLTWSAIPKMVFSDNGQYTYSLKLFNMGLLFSGFVGTFTSM